MNKKRFADPFESRWKISEPSLEDPILVVCPKCNSKGKIIPYEENRVKMTCFNCGFSQSKSTIVKLFSWGDVTPTDGYFGFGSFGFSGLGCLSWKSEDI